MLKYLNFFSAQTNKQQTKCLNLLSNKRKVFFSIFFFFGGENTAIPGKRYYVVDYAGKQQVKHMFVVGEGERGCVVRICVYGYLYEIFALYFFFIFNFKY